MNITDCRMRVLVLFVTWSLLVHLVAASSWYVDPRHGSDSNGCTSSLPCQSIQRALSVSGPGDVIMLRPAVFLLGASMYIPSPLTIMQDPETQGEVLLQSSVPCLPQSLFVALASFTLDGLVFSNFTVCTDLYTPSAAVVSATADLTVQNCVFRNISSPVSTGGAIMIFSGNLRISLSRFERCSSVYSGGAIAFNSTTGNMTILGSTFVQCHASINGGSVFAAGGQYVLVQDSAFRDGHANMSGAALDLFAVRSATVLGCVFNDLWCTISSIVRLPPSTSLSGSTVTLVRNSNFTDCSVLSAMQTFGTDLPVLVYPHPVLLQASVVDACVFTRCFVSATVLPSPSTIVTGSAVLVQGTVSSCSFIGCSASLSLPYCTNTIFPSSVVMVLGPVSQSQFLGCSVATFVFGTDASVPADIVSTVVMGGVSSSVFYNVSVVSTVQACLSAHALFSSLVFGSAQDLTIIGGSASLNSTLLRCKTTGLVQVPGSYNISAAVIRGDSTAVRISNCSAFAFSKTEPDGLPSSVVNAFLIAGSATNVVINSSAVNARSETYGASSQSSLITSSMVNGRRIHAVTVHNCSSSASSFTAGIGSSSRAVLAYALSAPLSLNPDVVTFPVISATTVYASSISNKDFVTGTSSGIACMDVLEGSIMDSLASATSISVSGFGSNMANAFIVQGNLVSTTVTRCSVLLKAETRVGYISDTTAAIAASVSKSFIEDCNIVSIASSLSSVQDIVSHAAFVAQAPSMQTLIDRLTISITARSFVKSVTKCMFFQGSATDVEVRRSTCNATAVELAGTSTALSTLFAGPALGVRVSDSIAAVSGSSSQLGAIVGSSVQVSGYLDPSTGLFRRSMFERLLMVSPASNVAYVGPTVSDSEFVSTNLTIATSFSRCLFTNLASPGMSGSVLTGCTIFQDAAAGTLSPPSGTLSFLYPVQAYVSNASCSAVIPGGLPFGSTCQCAPGYGGTNCTMLSNSTLIIDPVIPSAIPLRNPQESFLSVSVHGIEAQWLNTCVCSLCDSVWRYDIVAGRCVVPSSANAICAGPGNYSLFLQCDYQPNLIYVATMRMFDIGGSVPEATPSDYGTDITLVAENIPNSFVSCQLGNVSVPAVVSSEGNLVCLRSKLNGSLPVTPNLPIIVSYIDSSRLNGSMNYQLIRTPLFATLAVYDPSLITITTANMRGGAIVWRTPSITINVAGAPAFLGYRSSMGAVRASFGLLSSMTKVLSPTSTTVTYASFVVDTSQFLVGDVAFFFAANGVDYRSVLQTQVSPTAQIFQVHPSILVLNSTSNLQKQALNVSFTSSFVYGQSYCVLRSDTVGIFSPAICTDSDPTNGCLAGQCLFNASSLRSLGSPINVDFSLTVQGFGDFISGAVLILTDQPPTARGMVLDNSGLLSPVGGSLIEVTLFFPLGAIRNFAFLFRSLEVLASSNPNSDPVTLSLQSWTANGTSASFTVLTPGLRPGPVDLALSFDGGKFLLKVPDVVVVGNCSAGSYFNYNASTCTLCLPGSSSSDGFACHPCPAGYLQPTVGGTVCVPCPRNTISSAGASSCYGCDPGYVPSSNQTQCNLCPPGYEPSEDRSYCAACPASQYSNGTMIACAPCGSNMHVVNATSCEICPTGTRSLDGISCTACPGGFVVDLSVPGFCRQCDPGYVSTLTSGCVMCPAGKEPSADRSYCTYCSASTWSNGSMLACASCPNSMHVVNGTHCASCPMGSRSLDAISCTACPAGFVVDITVPGYCRQCRAGYVPNFNRTVCERCSGNTVADINGECVSCVPFRPSDDFLTCVACPAGQHANFSTGECVVCPPGKTSATDGSCTDCQRGSFSGPSTQGLCVDCGTVLRGSGVISSFDHTTCICMEGYMRFGSSCQTCPTGSDCSQDGTTAATVASVAGYWRTNSDQPTVQFYKCMSQGCIGGTGDNQCASGYEGPVCGVCSAGYTKVAATCARCPHPVAVVCLLLLAMIVVVGAVLFLARNAFRTRAKRVSLLKILLGHAQMLSILASFAYYWPGPIALGLNSMSSGGSFSFEPILQTVQCLFPVSFYARYYLTLLSPAILLCLLLPAVWYMRTSGRTQIHEYSVAVFVSLACHAFVLFGALSVFRCTTIANKEVLAVNPSVECKGPEFQFAQVMGGVTAIGYGLLFPLSLVYLSKRPASEGIPKLHDYCRAMISSGFRPSVWFTEILYVLRKGIFATLAVCSAISSTSAEGNSISLASVTFVALGLLSLYFFMHASMKPFPTRNLNLFESLAEYLQIMSLITAYIITERPQDEQLVAGLGWTVLVMNAVFFVAGTLVFLYPLLLIAFRRICGRRTTQEGVSNIDPVNANSDLGVKLLSHSDSHEGALTKHTGGDSGHNLFASADHDGDNERL